jgi:hypothetical protein
MQIKSFSIREDLWQELQRQTEREELLRFGYSS